MMKSPFLEISIEKMKELEISSKHILQKIGEAFQIQYQKDSKIINWKDKLCLRIDFSSKSDFEKIYESSYSFYVYIFENFLNDNIEFKSLFQNKSKTPKENSLDSNQDNYMILRYRTNYIEPMRRYYGFTTRVNRIFGAKVINEEIQDGYLRFISTKMDFESLLVPGDDREGWEEYFRVREVDLNHPSIKEFYKFVEKWEKES